jgi:hypothetical protein
MIPRAFCIFFIACLTSVSALADYLEVRRPATVYADSDKASEAIFKPPTGAVLILLENDTKNGYYHVQYDATGQSGWIYKTLVRRHPGAPSAAPTGGTPPATGGIPTGGFPVKKCASPYNEESSAPTPFDQSCGLSGSAAPDSGELPQDISKNDLCEKSAAVPVKTADLVELQSLVDASGMIYGSRFSGKGPPKERTILHNLANLQSGVKLEEDDVVTYVGFLVEAHYMPQSEKPPKTGKGGESVNCNSTEHVKADIHLALSDTKGRITAKDPNRTKKLCSTISAEMIPHLRPAVWNGDNLDQVIDLERPVKVTGHLFFDASHQPCKGSTPVGSDPRRVTEWEIHPIYSFEICKFDAISQCDASKASDWQPISKAAGINLEAEFDN